MEKSKVSALVGKYIENCQEAFDNDSDIIDGLTEIFTREELEDLGYGDFIKDYFDDEDEDKIEYRVMIGEDGDDYIYQGKLSWEEAYATLEQVKSFLKPGAYARVELDG